MTDGEGGRIGGRRPYGFARTILAALALGAILCAALVLAQTAPPAAAPAAGPAPLPWPKRNLPGKNREPPATCQLSCAIRI